MQESVERLLEEDTFSVYTPNGFGILEELEKSGVNLEEVRPIGGHCSTESLDRQGEVVFARGLDFSEFILWGYFNDNHRQETAAILGYPSKAELRNGRWWTEGNLLRGYGPADRVWELAKALQKSNAPRRLGFSIEGKVIARDEGNKITRAKIRNVAITNCPVNTDCTWDILAKAFSDPVKVTDRAKAMMVGHNSNPLDLESLEGESIERPRGMSFQQAVERVRQLRPHLSKAAAQRIVQFAVSRT